MSRIRTNLITNRMANGAPTVSNGLVISGVTTVTTLDLNGDVDVDGHTNLDNVSVAGVSTFSGNLDAGGGIDVTGNIVATGTIETTGNELKITGAEPRLTFTDTDNNPDFQIWANAQKFSIYDSTNSATRINIDSSGHVCINTTTEGQADADDLTIANSGHCGMTIRSGTSSEGNIFFSDGTSGADEYRGIIRFDHSTNEMVFKTVSADKFRIKSDGSLIQSSTGSFTIAKGTTGERPSGVEGMIRFNTTLSQTEEYRDSGWYGLSNKSTVSGGTVTTSGGYTIHTFTSSGTLTVAGQAKTGVDYLLVAGGAGGGSTRAGGGGAGGMTVTTGASIPVGTYTITVGSGGAGAVTNGNGNADGAAGSNTSFGSLSSVSGGGYGGGQGRVGGGGGSGGGGSDGQNGGAGTSGQGNSGGNSTGSTGGGGGGGKGGQGNQGASSLVGGGGGAAGASNYSGSNINYSGGGGGGSRDNGTPGNGGGGGAGNGGQNGSNLAGNASANQGGGGGGGARYHGASGASYNGGNGGSGIVIIRYLT